jgi:hypothetical protein
MTLSLGNHKGNKNCFGEEPEGYTKKFWRLPEPKWWNFVIIRVKKLFMLTSNCVWKHKQFCE